jgi:hypothetical protein
MNIAAILRLRDTVDPENLRRTIAERVCAVPRLRQLVRPTVPRSRHLVWAPDPQFAIENHLSVAACPPPGDDQALLRLAAAEAGAALPRDRPLWRAVQVTGMPYRGDAVIIVLHHAVADGVGGLTVLTQLADPPDGRRTNEVDPTRSPSGQDDSALRQSQVPTGAASGPPPRRGPRRRRTSSLNRPIGPRRLAVATAPLRSVVEAAHRSSVTVNDLLLVAVADALGTVLAAQGEQLGSVVVSVPVSQRPGTPTGALGNRVGVMPVRVPSQGPLSERVHEVAATTRRRATSARRTGRLGPSQILTGPVFGLLRRLGLFRWFIDHQRLVDTFVTNVHGPQQPLSLLGVPVAAITPASPIAGNVTVGFTAFSYAGTLSVTVVADAGRWPDPRPIAAALGRALDRVTNPLDGTH